VGSVAAETADEAPAASARRVAHAGLVAVIAVTVLVLDQASKHWALNRLDAFRFIEITDWFRLELTWNTGTAFSIGSG
jgi:lipoprotein signal peptidase